MQAQLIRSRNYIMQQNVLRNYFNNISAVAPYCSIFTAWSLSI